VVVVVGWRVVVVVGWRVVVVVGWRVVVVVGWRVVVVVGWRVVGMAYSVDEWSGFRWALVSRTSQLVERRGCSRAVCHAASATVAGTGACAESEACILESTVAAEGRAEPIAAKEPAAGRWRFTGAASDERDQAAGEQGAARGVEADCQAFVRLPS
jgi:hypothetical protein